MKMNVTHLTRYQVSQLLNMKLVELGMEKVPSQRLYNKSTKIRLERVGDQELVPVEEAIRFVREFVSRKETSKTNLNEILELIDE